MKTRALIIVQCALLASLAGKIYVLARPLGLRLKNTVQQSPKSIL